MRATYEAHVTRSCARRSFEPSVPEADLTEVAKGKYLRRDAARPGDSGCSATRARPSGRRRRRATPEALAVRSFGITSAYRSASHQYRLWNNRFRRLRGRHRPAAGRPAGRADGRPGGAVARPLDRRLAGRTGILQPQRRPRHRPVLPPDQRAGAHAPTAATYPGGDTTWLHQWLTANAARYDFHPYLKEPWHWEHRPGPASATLTLPRPATESEAEAEPGRPLIAAGPGAGGVLEPGSCDSGSPEIPSSR